MDIPNAFFTWAFLATLSGAAIGTGLATQFVKEYFKKLPTQILSYIIANILLTAAFFFTGILTVESASLIPLNAIVVALTANGGYSAAKRFIPAMHKKE